MIQSCPKRKTSNSEATEKRFRMQPLMINNERIYSFCSAIRRVVPVNCSFSFHVGMSRPDSRQGCKEVKHLRKTNLAFNVNKNTHVIIHQNSISFLSIMPSPKSTSVLVLYFLPPFPGHPCHLGVILSLALLQCLVLFVISIHTFTFHLAVY